MPLYDYECDDCGVFTANRPMAEAAERMVCPECAVPSVRVYLVAPATAMMDGATRKAIAGNERSANEPRRSAGHGAGCSCCGTSRLKGKAAAPARAAAKSFPGARPWMISH